MSTISINQRGNMTLPLNARNQFATSTFKYTVETDRIILEPLYTESEFHAILDKIEEDYDKNGGYTLEEVKKRHNLK